MDRNSKVLLVIFLILLTISIFFAYHRFFTAKDYIIFGEEEVPVE
jgi:hypothetical protein